MFALILLFGVVWGETPVFQTPGYICSSNSIRKALRAEPDCQLRDKVIPVPWPNTTNPAQMIPRHVIVKRCSGTCGKSCVPLSYRKRDVSVIIGKCSVLTGKCSTECMTLEVEDHVQCGCNCMQSQVEKCNEKTHVFFEDTCECHCRNQEDKRECLETQENIWDTKKCRCKIFCKNQQERTKCLLDLTKLWDENTCKCY